MPAITFPRMATDKIEVIAPEVFSMGSEIDSSINILIATAFTYYSISY